MSVLLAFLFFFFFSQRSIGNETDKNIGYRNVDIRQKDK